MLPPASFHGSVQTSSLYKTLLTEEDIARMDRLGIPPERRDEFVQDVGMLLSVVFDTLFHTE